MSQLVMTRKQLLRVSRTAVVAGTALAVGGLVSFEEANVRHTELRSLLMVFAGLAVVVVGVLSVAMCKIATAAIAPRLMATLIEDEFAPGQQPPPQLRLLTTAETSPLHRHG